MQNVEQFANVSTLVYGGEILTSVPIISGAAFSAQEEEEDEKLIFCSLNKFKIHHLHILLSSERPAAVL
jgi:hypothetical protein